MFKKTSRNKKISIIVALSLLISVAVGGFTVSFAKDTAASKRKEAVEAAKKAAAATKNFEAAEKELIQLQKDMKAKKKEIEETKKKVKKKEKEVNEQSNALDDRLTAMYKTGTVGYVDVILGSQDISELISNIGMVQQILESDQELLKKMEKDLKELKKLKENLEDQEAQLEAQKVETEELKKKYKKEADKYKKQEEELLAEADRLAALAAQNSGNADDIISAHGGNLNTKNYSFPVPNGYYLSSDYGWRICPFHGHEFHNGIDLAMSSGTPVFAINDGVIQQASWYGGYGNCIILNVAKGYSALYGHLSGYNCHAKQYVKRGQIIGYIGSTGNSTGPHLHFTVFHNGTTVSPWSLY